MGITTMAQLKQDIALARTLKPLTRAEMDAMAGRFREVSSDGRHELFKSTQRYDGVHHRKQHTFDV